MEVAGTRLVERLQARGHRFTVITDSADDHLPERDTLGDVPIHRYAFIKTVRAGDPRGVTDLHRRVGRALDESAPDLVHLNAVDASGLFCALALARCRVPLLITQHGLFGPVQPLGRDTLSARLFARAARVVGPSTAVLEDVCRAFPSVRPRAAVIHYGLPSPSAPPAPASFDPPRLLCLGRLVRQKGMDRAVEALPKIRARFPHARLVVAGQGPERPVLEDRARQLGIEDAVEFPGWVSPAAVPALMREASLVLIPSRHAEGFGLVALEAGHAERAVVASRIPGLDEAVADGETGLLVEPDDPVALAAGVIGLLADTARAERLGRQGRQRALTLGDPDRSADRYDRLYRQIVEEENQHEHRSAVHARQP